MPEECLPLCDTTRAATSDERRACKDAMKQLPDTDQKRNIWFNAARCIRGKHQFKRLKFAEILYNITVGFSDGVDRQACCRENGVPATCLDICDGRQVITRENFRRRKNCGGKKPFNIFRQCQVGTNDQGDDGNEDSKSSKYSCIG